MKALASTLPRTSAPALLLVAAAALLASGCGPAWTVVRQANPNPFSAQKGYAVEPVTYSGLMVGKKSEQQYLSEKEQKTQDSWKADQAALSQSFATSLGAAAKGLQVTAGTPAAPGPFVVRANVGFIEPGVFTMVFNLPSEVRMTIQVLDPQGAVLDEITTLAKVSPGSIMGVPTNVSVGERLRKCGQILGEIAAQYLRQRSGVK